MSAAELDKAALRLEEIELETGAIRAKLQEQIDTFGSIPPRSEKSKRLQTEAYQFTLSTSTSTEIRDAEVLHIKELCSDEVFSSLFQQVTKFKLASSAMRVLAGTLPKNSPSNLRKLFSQAVVLKEGALRLRIEKLEAEPAA